MLITRVLHVMSCCCYHKGTYFQANHNLEDHLSFSLRVVVATTKVRIFKQITTRSGSIEKMARCCCYHKGTYFQANHNKLMPLLLRMEVVVATTKVRIFKQITTKLQRQRKKELLLLLPQRYVFSSKSQHSHLVYHFLPVVVATTKVRIFKQITTVYLKGRHAKSCCCYHKGTYFQANHNR